MNLFFKILINLSLFSFILDKLSFKEGPAATLLENDIKPDFVLFADVVSVKHTIEGIKDELNSCNIIADARANSIIFDDFSNILTYFSKFV